ncbi:hypothetical protein GCM10022227_34450 [Streptomyces sedi]
MAPSGWSYYARFAPVFAGVREVTVLPHPGFATGEPLPATRELAIAFQAEAARRQAAGRPFVLAGYSSGGWLTNAVAAELERRGCPPAGVVLLDPYTATTSFESRLETAMRERTRTTNALDLITGVTLTAQGGYLRAFDDWEPEPVDARTLYVHAAFPPGETAEVEVADDWQPTWPFPHEDAFVPGDHFTIMEDHSETTAHAVQSWLAEADLDAAPAPSAGTD